MNDLGLFKKQLLSVIKKNNLYLLFSAVLYLYVINNKIYFRLIIFDVSVLFIFSTQKEKHFLNS